MLRSPNTPEDDDQRTSRAAHSRLLPPGDCRHLGAKADCRRHERPVASSADAPATHASASGWRTARAAAPRPDPVGDDTEGIRQGRSLESTRSRQAHECVPHRAAPRYLRSEGHATVERSPLTGSMPRPRCCRKARGLRCARQMVVDVRRGCTSYLTVCTGSVTASSASAASSLPTW
jgi:hypothetical protein